MKLWICTAFFSMVAFAIAQNDAGYSAFAKANTAYTNGDYQEAINSYNSILQSGLQSAEVYFNLGNAYYKQNEVGPAIFNYEKALQLDPGNKEVKNNLRFAQQLRIDAIQPLAENPIEKFLKDTATSTTVDNWAYISIILALIAVLMFLLYHYAKTTGKKRLFFTLSLILFLLVVLSIVAASYAHNLNNSSNQAIVFSQETVTRAEPKSNADPSFAVHEGTKVSILEEYQNWAHIQLANGSEAWMPLADLKKL
ncbi:tetratricopeptide repeat protein [Nonlabens marinus]|uniref:Bacteroides aerotolerance protein BatE n=1 Tax=Nonlabens marinus S1-08 TaxID=1454201 RepID=W8VUV3_9FLAO|nr:tetratricopeptide repeat protein [Nonlabens marinus]BAO54923.1 Bacteroides aerotolerance protein BatE [Nonlabens marinus S1-08]